MSKTMKIILLVLAGIVGGIWGWLDNAPSHSYHEEAAEEVDGAGIEIEYATTLSDRPEQIIKHTAYTVSFNSEWQLPNWVGYELTNNETFGDVPRSKKFTTDPLVEGRCATTDDYTHSGYDRGHMAPAADMKWSQTAMDESFYTTNICPQNRNLNAGDWNDLEEYARVWARMYNYIYIVCGPVVGKNPKTIGENKVAVPEGFFKVFLRKDKPTNSWKTIAFYFKNEAGNRDLDVYIKSVNEIEAISGIDFFAFLPDDIEESVESQKTDEGWL
ncbi:MAG: DNA/RNA non-specific endonuclease [Bacteroidales bacterium]|nr:DNA/RNA non-specific endonuclease [Bacteroidales bacterium]